MIAFSPFFPLTVMIAIAVVAAALAVFGIARRLRGAWLRALALGLQCLALANPS